MRLFHHSVFLSALLALGACAKKDPGSSDPSPRDPYPVLEATYTRFEPQASERFRLVNDTLISKPLIEISGLVSGRKNPGVLYMHEDSGNPNKVSVYDTLGQYKGDIILSQILNRDWEDIAIGPGPIEGETYLYIGDFGDNRAQKEEVRIHRLVEPLLDLSGSSPFDLVIARTEVETILYQYPDGPRDAETLLLDPLTKDLVVITKREAGVHVYQLPFPQATEGYAEIHYRGRLPFRSIVGGDLSADGSQAVIKDYGAVYYWPDLSAGLIESLFGLRPEKTAYLPEFQGESIGFSPDARSYFTISETKNNPSFDPILYHYRRP